ncbi:MAG: zinc-ribbon domain-containing protein [Olsenella sp.]|nr:zinc-ribbon domain-containing protein [Olsenella sp.]
MFCPNCGGELRNGARFCTECGTGLAKYVIPTTGSSSNAYAGSADAPAVPTAPARTDGGTGAGSAAPLAPQPSRGAAPGSGAATTQPADDKQRGGNAKKAGISALLATTVQLAGTAVPAFALAVAGTLAIGTLGYAVAATYGIVPPIWELWAPDAGNPEVINRKAHEEYEKVLEEYRSSIRDRSTDSNNLLYVPASILKAFSNQDVKDVIRYAYLDLNQDGVDELFIGLDIEGFISPSEVLCTSFTFKNGTVQKLLESSVRTDGGLGIEYYQLLEGGAIGRDYQGYSILQIDERGSLKEVESHQIDSSMITNRYTGTHTLNGEVVETTEDPTWGSHPNSDRVINAMKAEHPVRTDLGWQLL